MRSPAPHPARASTAAGTIQQAFEGAPQKYGPGGVLRSSEGIEYEHDAAGRRSAKRSDDFRKRDGYHWDDRDRLVAITSSDGRRVDFAYDALNRRVKKTASGVETVFVWDGEVLLHELSTKGGLSRGCSSLGHLRRWQSCKVCVAIRLSRTRLERRVRLCVHRALITRQTFPFNPAAPFHRLPRAPSPPLSMAPSTSPVSDQTS